MNRNETLMWVKESVSHKIDIGSIEGIKPIRGIYGIFIQNEEDEICAYIGKSTNIYKRFFCWQGHFVRLKNGTFNNEEINSAMEDDSKKIKVKVLKEVPYIFDNYNKDMQRLASEENKLIDYYQSMDQCLEQRPDGSNLDKDKWEEAKKYLGEK